MIARSAGQEKSTPSASSPHALETRTGGTSNRDDAGSRVWTDLSSSAASGRVRHHVTDSVRVKYLSAGARNGAGMPADPEAAGGLSR